jgi:hypothetical protein
MHDEINAHDNRRQHVGNSVLLIVGPEKDLAVKQSPHCHHGRLAEGWNDMFRLRCHVSKFTKAGYKTTQETTNTDAGRRR